MRTALAALALLGVGGAASAPTFTLAATAKSPVADPAPVPADEAPIALLVDLTSGQVLHARNANRRFMPASVTKTMTAYVVFELLEQGRLAANQRVTISDTAFEDWHRKGSTMYLEPDTPATIDQLLRGLLTVSANDGAVVLAETGAGSVAEWVKLMNAEARKLEMTDSHFGTPNGFPDEGHTFTTAQDLVKLARAIILQHPQRFARYFGHETFTWNEIEQRNHDPMVGRIKGADGLKTGFTNEAGFTYLGTAKRNGQRLVLVLAGVKSGAARDRMARAYIEWGFATFDRKKLLRQGDIVGSVRVQGGSMRNLPVVTDRVVYANVPKARASQLSATIQYDGPVRAPIKAGERVGTLEIDVPGMEPARVPLLAQVDVSEAGVFDRLINGIAGWFS